MTAEKPKEMPEPIDADPEDVARALLTAPPRRREDWKYMRDAEDD